MPRLHAIVYHATSFDGRGARHVEDKRERKDQNAQDHVEAGQYERDALVTLAGVLGDVAPEGVAEPAMALCEDGAAVPAPFVAAHGALHAVAFEAAVAAVGAVHLCAALGTDLKLLATVAELEVFFAGEVWMSLVVANKADRLTT